MGISATRIAWNSVGGKVIVGATAALIGLGACGTAADTTEPTVSATAPETTDGAGTTGEAEVLDFAFTEAQLASVKESAEQINEANGSAGWFIGVWDPLRGDVEAFEPNMDPEGYFRIGGITETMTAVAVLRLAEQGILTLDTTLATYLPEVPNADAITVQMLLNQTSGLADIATDASFRDAYLADPNLPWTVEDSLALLRSLPPAAEPGADQVLNLTNYIVLGEVITQATGRPAADVLADEINRPGGLRRTAFPTDPDLPTPAVPGVVTVDGAQRPVDLQNPAVQFTAGFAISSITDLRSWVSQLTTGDLLTAESFALQLPPAATDQPTYGLGLTDFGGWLGHGGVIPGYETMMLREPNSGAVVIAVSTGGELDSRAADDVAFTAITTLYPGQYPVIANQAPPTAD